MKLALTLLALTSPVLFAQSLQIPDSIPLWKHGAPGSEDQSGEPEKIDHSEDGKKFNVSKVHNPSITPFLPATDKATGAAVLIAPGGEHRVLCLGHEGWSLGQYLADKGIAAFASMEFDSGKADAAAPIERQGSRPAFQGLIYPGTSDLFSPSPNSPPLFVACGFHDRDDIAYGMANLYLKYKKAGIPSELHIYSNAEHGFGYRPNKKNAAGHWTDRFHDWLYDFNFIKKL